MLEPRQCKRPSDPARVSRRVADPWMLFVSMPQAGASPSSLLSSDDSLLDCCPQLDRSAMLEPRHCKRPSDPARVSRRVADLSVTSATLFVSMPQAGTSTSSLSSSHDSSLDCCPQLDRSAMLEPRHCKRPSDPARVSRRVADPSMTSAMLFVSMPQPSPSSSSKWSRLAHSSASWLGSVVGEISQS